MSYTIEYFCVSHTGRVRSANQDNFFCLNRYMNYDNNGTEKILGGKITNKDPALFAVFDGMGGEERGEMASYIASHKMKDFSFDGSAESSLLSFCFDANKAICNFADENYVNTMGTTAAIILADKKKINICNIGDSKIFRFSKGKLTQVSHDHLSIALPGKKAPLSQNLGIPEDEMIISPYVADCPYADKDVYLICSDGLTDMVSNEEIEKVLNITKKEYAAGILLKKALENGGRDNTTIILLYLTKENDGLLSFLK